jgi:imidazoleglycerol-phosphate dehydratase
METRAANIERIISERARLETELTRLPGAHPLPSQASFILCRFEGRQGPELAAALARRGILVRSFSARELSDALRFTVGRPEQNDAVLVALRDTLSGIPRELSPINIRSPEAIRAPRPSDPGVMVPGSRQSRIHRQTRETDVEVSFDLDGAGGYKIETGLGFLDHMLSQLAAHGLFDLTVRARGDLEIDEHHTVEDVAIGLGRALDTALGDRHGIVRMGQAYAPLDEALAHVVVDLSGRPYAVIEVEFGAPQLGDVTADLIVHLLETLAFQARMALHARVLYGRNDHHKAEALFKALGRALDAATRLDPRRSDAPSTKGVL